MQQVELLAPFGESDAWSMAIALAFIALDVAFGLAKATKNKVLSSSVMREGLWHKAAFVGVIVLAAAVQMAASHMDLGFAVPLVVPACVYIVVNEVMSIVESLAEINPELKGSKLLALFDSAKGEKKEEDGNDAG